jgi:hypothetical protein
MLGSCVSGNDIIANSHLIHPLQFVQPDAELVRSHAIFTRISIFSAVETAQDMLLHYAACAVVGHELFAIISIREEEVEAFVKFLALDAIVPQACDDFVLKCPQESSEELVRGFRGAIQQGRNTHIYVHRGTAEHRLVSCCARSRRSWYRWRCRYCGSDREHTLRNALRVACRTRGGRSAYWRVLRYM